MLVFIGIILVVAALSMTIYIIKTPVRDGDRVKILDSNL